MTAETRKMDRAEKRRQARAASKPAVTPQVSPRVAYHEAGHAVVDCLLGISFKEVNVNPRVWPMQDGMIGVGTDGVVYDPPLDVRLLTPDEQRNWVVSYMAGPFAEAGAGFDGQDGSISDKQAVRRLMSLLGTRDIDKFSSRAAELVEEHWNAINAVAHFLSERKALTQAEVATILAAVNK